MYCKCVHLNAHDKQILGNGTFSVMECYKQYVKYISVILYKQKGSNYTSQPFETTTIDTDCIGF